MTSQQANDLTERDHIALTDTSIEVVDLEETEEEDGVTLKEPDEKTTRVIYQHYGLKGLANPRVKLPCVIVKDHVSLSDWCHTHDVDITHLKRVNVHIDETIQTGQVLILPDGVSYT
jgi:hypothetical protein